MLIPVNNDFAPSQNPHSPEVFNPLFHRFSTPFQHPQIPAMERRIPIPRLRLWAGDTEARVAGRENVGTSVRACK